MRCKQACRLFVELIAKRLEECVSRLNYFIIALILFPALIGTAPGAATFQVGSMPVTAVANTGLTERAGAIVFTQLFGPSDAGKLIISYGVPITVDFSNVVVSTSADSGYATAVPIPGDGFVASVTVSTAESNYAAGFLVLNVPGGVSAGWFSVSGVRVSVAETGLTMLWASISIVGNFIVAGQTNPVVIGWIGPGIGSIKTITTGFIDATTGAVTAQPVITVKEGFANAWGDPATATNAGIRIALSQAPPPGVTIVFPATAITDGAGAPEFTTMLADGTIDGSPITLSSDSTDPTVYYRATTTTDWSKSETLTIAPTIQVDSGVISLPMPAFTITYSVSLAPIGTAFDVGGIPITVPELIPRYIRSDVGPAPFAAASVKKRAGQITSQ
jgi:hypothetical protein